MSMPIIETSMSLDLKDELSKLGITDVFTDDCDFTGMLLEPDPVERAIHKAVIKVF